MELMKELCVWLYTVGFLQSDNGNSEILVAVKSSVSVEGCCMGEGVGEAHRVLDREKAL